MKRNDPIAVLIRAYIHRQENPDRVGCPRFQRLEAFLRGQLKQEVAERLCDHLPHCRECLLEIRTLYDIAQRETGKVWR